MVKVLKKDIEVILSLTPMQEGMLLHYLKEPESDDYIEQLCLEVSGNIERSCFEKAWNDVVRSNEMLRTIFRWEHLEKPTQIILKNHRPDLRFFDLSDIPGDEEQQKRLNDIKEQDRDEKFDLMNVPFRVSLCKISEEVFWIIISNHHILLDGWSTGIIIREFFQAYNKDGLLGRKGAEAARCLSPKPPFREIVRWYRDSNKKGQQEFWQSYLQGIVSATDLPVKKKKSIRETSNETGKEFPFALDTDLTGRIEAFVKEKRVTWAALLYTAWGILLQKYCNSSDVLFGTTVSGRSAPIQGIEKMVGLLINTLVLRVSSEPDGAIFRSVSKINQDLLQREKYENTSLVDIKKYSRGNPGEDLFDTIMVIENYPLDHFLMGEQANNSPDGLRVSSYSIQESAPDNLVIAISLSGEIAGRFLYHGELFAEDTIQRLAGHFIAVLKNIIEGPDKNVSQIDWLSSQEKQQLLLEFNPAPSPYPFDKPLTRIFSAQVENTPHHVVLTAQGEENMGTVKSGGAITYKELNKRAERLAGLLRTKDIIPDTPVAVMVERSFEMFIAILGIFKAGGAYLPIDSDYPSERVKYMLRDSYSSVLLTHSVVLRKKGPAFAGETLFLDDGELFEGENFVKKPVNINRAGDLAYIIYTSGSTGRPKGVMVTHRNVARLVIDTNYMSLSGETRILQTSAPVFDVSVFEMWGPFLNGGQAFLVGKEVILDANRLGDALIRFNINTLWLSAPLFDQLTAHNSDIYSGLSYLLVGGDVLTPRYINLTRRKNKKLKIINCYGPTENSTFSTTFSIEKEYHSSIPVGSPINNSTVYIVDRYDNLLPVGVPGELLVGGDGVARGYLNNPELTMEKFVQLHFSHSTVTHRDRPAIYRTGDIACWQADGNIEFFGRKDFQVKIRGFRIELGEIERHLLRNKDVSDTVVIPGTDPLGGKYITAYVVMTGGGNGENGGVEKTAKFKGIREYLTDRLPDYMIPSRFILLDKIPLNVNGKVDVKALPPIGPITQSEYIAPDNEVEAELVRIWAGVLGIDVSKIGVGDSFFELGGHSLNITALIGRIHKKLGIRIPISEIYIKPTVRDVAGFIHQARKETFQRILSVEKKEYYQLSAGQERLFVLQQMETGSVVYNVHGIMLLEGDVEKSNLAGKFSRLIDRHESLRTTFHMLGNRPVQRINTGAEFSIELAGYPVPRIKPFQKTCVETEEGILENQGLTIENQIRSFIRPFDLGRASLIRVGLIELAQRKHIFILDMHHIISDGTSVGILIKDFLSLYTGKELAAQRLQYRDYAEWQKNRETEKSIEGQEKYWLKELAGEIPTLNLSTDFIRPNVQDFSGAHLEFEMGPEETRALKAIALEENTTLFGVLAAAFHILLFKLTGQEDIIVGTVVANRRHIDLSQILGMFVNTLALRNYPVGEKPVKDFLREVKNRTAQAFENQEYPFETLVEKLSLNRDAGRNPLFDVIFVLQNQDIPQIEIPGLKVEPYPYDNGLSKFDLTFFCENVGESVQYSVEYSTKLFKKETIQHYIKYYKRLITDISQNREKKIWELEILSEQEKKSLLEKFYIYDSGYRNDKTIPQLFREQARQTPDSTALAAPYNWERSPNGVCQTREANFCVLTYRELDRSSGRLTRYLLHRGVKPGGFVGILVKRSLEMIVGILGIVKTGCAYVPMDPKAPAARNRYILKECNIPFLLTNCWQEELIPEVEVVDLSNPDIYSEPGQMSGTEPRERLHEVYPSAANFAYVIFTSGSTGLPKGVPITHANFSQLLHWSFHQLKFGPGDRALQTLSYYFDWSVMEIFVILTTGVALYIVGEDVLLNPEFCIDFMKSRSITIMHITPTQYGYLVNTGRKIPSLRHLLFGGEKLTTELVQRSYTVNSPHCLVYNVYGPTEATITCAIQVVDHESYKKYSHLISIPIGIPPGNIQVFILDKYLKLCPFNVVGELFIAGEGVSQGYLNKPELTAEKFITSIPGNCILYYSDKIYRTGDLTRWLAGGIIEYLGRIDHQVKIRGNRIELGEIENRLLNHEAIKEAVVVDKKYSDGDIYLCAYIVVADNYGLEGEAVKEYLAEQLPDYMVPSVLMFIEQLPLNPNGKVDRRALPEPDTDLNNAAYKAPRNQLELKLAKIWAEVLNIEADSAKQRIGIDDNFFEIGGHSLKATLLTSKLHKIFNIKISLVEIFTRPTIRLMAEYIKESKRESFISIEPVEKRDFYPLSSAQKRMYLLQEMDLENTAYNIPNIMAVEGDIDVNKFKDIFCALIIRHESLRTFFTLVNDEPVQRIVDRLGFEIEYEQLASPGYAGIIKKFIRPFMLNHAPLLRVRLAKIGEKKFLFLMDMHHIISDGTSMEVMIKDFIALYGDEALPELKYRYKDFSKWQDSEVNNKAIKKQEQYWRQQLGGELPRLNLPLDFVRPGIQTFAGSGFYFELESVETHNLQSCAREGGVTLFMVMSAIFNIFLSKLGNQEDILIGTPVAARRHADLEHIIGMFVNTLAMRNYPTADKSLKEYLQEVSQNTLKAFDNQEYPFENLVEVLELDRDASRNPLFDVMLVYQESAMNRFEVPGLKMQLYPYEERDSKFDLTLYVEDREDSLRCCFEYSTNLFKSSTIRRYADYFRQIVFTLGDISFNEVKIGEIEIITEAEKREILSGFNAASSAYPREKTLMDLFRLQVERTPHRLALISNWHLQLNREDNVQLTYRELERLSGRSAFVLKQKGVEKDTIVGLMSDRSIEMVVALYGILKAGGAYMPVAPDYPAQRIGYMLEESNCPLLLSLGNRERSIRFNGEVFDPAGDMLRHEPVDKKFPHCGSPENLVYVIYTSGSTGKPKGVPIRTGGFVNLVHWYISEFGFDTRDRNLLIAPISFDLAQKNLFSPLLSGGSLGLPAPGLLDYSDLSTFIFNSGQTVINCAPSAFYPFVEFNGKDHFKKLKSLRYLFLGGEPIHMAQLSPWLDSFTCGCEVVNTYGPTECTDVVSYYRIPADAGNRPSVIPIGSAVGNVTLYILDKRQKVQPQGIPGEVCIGGVGVSGGYLNNPELTEEKFPQFSREDGSPRKGTTEKNLIGITPPAEIDRIYRTGDLGRWLSNDRGEIEFLGRIDHQVKIRGLRIELEEIEALLLDNKFVKAAAVSALADDERGNYLCAYLVPGPLDSLKTDLNAVLKEYLLEKLPSHMIPDYFVELESLPLTPSGKVDRKALPLPEIERRGKDFKAPRSRIEKMLADLWSKVLGIPRERIGIDDNFFELGGHSLKAAILVAKIHSSMEIKIPLVVIFNSPTISRLAQIVAEKEKEDYTSIAVKETGEFYRLSPAQRRQFLLYRMDPESTGYNIPAVLELEGNLDKDRLENAFNKLIRRHEGFRTSFLVIDGEPVQRIHDKVKFEVRYFNPDGEDHKNIIEKFIRPFDLSHPPLLRVGLIYAADSLHPYRSVLLIDMHHIVSDGTSMEVLCNDFLAIYDREYLAPLRIQYKDYASWQLEKMLGKELAGQEEFWLEEFSGQIPLLDLPLDFPRPPLQRFEGSHLVFKIDESLTAGLKRLALEHDATLFMVLLAIFNIFLAKLSGQEEVVVGFPVAGRNHSEIEPVIGMFVNTLALHNFPFAVKTFPELLNNVKERTLAAFENQEYPFEDLVEKIQVNRDTSRNPLFDVMLALQNTGNLDLNTREGELKLTLRDFQYGISKFDLTAVCLEEENHLRITFEYSTNLFTFETIERFRDYFQEVMAQVVRNPGISPAVLELVPPDERKRLLIDFNRLDSEFPVDRTLGQLFSQQVKRTSHHLALEGLSRASEKNCDAHHLSYKELNRKAGQLAGYIGRRNVKPGGLVGLLTDRSIEMIVGILGILKAGCGYVPLNPKAPAARNRYMINECDIRLLLTDIKQDMGNWPVEVADIANQEIYSGAADSRESTSASSIAYVIFTSGSTGNPKGVAITHTNLSPLLHWGFKYIGLNSSDRTLQNLSYYFDWSVWEIFIALTSGTSLHMISEAVVLNPEAQLQYIRDKAITVLHITPTHFQAMVNVKGIENQNLLRDLTCLALGAEKLTYDLVRRTWEKVSAQCRIFNMYGPTEATIMSAVLEIDKEKLKEYKILSSVPIGNTIANADLFILDKRMKICPLKVVGELYISGDGLAPGYLNNPQLTAARFITLTKFELTSNQRLLPEVEGGGILEKPPPRLCRLYKTGDLTRWLLDGTVEFLGRVDYQVKIRGFRIELGEIENRLLEYDYIHEAAVLDRQWKNNETYLCAYIVPTRDFSKKGGIKALKDFLMGMLPDYMIPSSFITLERMPLNPNKKVDRKALPEPETIGAGQEYIAPGTEVEKSLTQLWAEVLNIDTPIGIESDFFAIGGHSLKVLNLVNAIQKTFNIKIDVQDIFQSPRISQLARLIEKSERIGGTGIRSQEQKEYYDLSYAQRRLWILQQLEPDTTAFNLGGRIIIKERVDEEKIRRILTILVERHDGFRTFFKKIQGEPVQVLLPGVVVKPELVDLALFPVEEMEIQREKLFYSESIGTFDLENPPLLRIKIIRCRPDRYDILFTMHHIISDGWSLEVLEREFLSLYESFKRGELLELGKLPLQYKDYAAWHNRLLANEAAVADAKDFWKRILHGAINPVPLPYDYPKKENVSSSSAGYRIVVPDKIVSRLRLKAREQKASLFMVLLSGFSLLLYRISGQDNFALGIPAAGREHQDLKKIIGLFVNTLIIGIRHSREDSFMSLLKQVQEKMVQVLKYQGIPLELICSELKFKYPVLTTYFNMTTFGEVETLPLSDRNSYHISQVQNAKFDMVCYLTEFSNGVSIETHYKKDLFKAATIEKILQKYLGILEEVALGQESRIKVKRKLRRKN